MSKIRHFREFLDLQLFAEGTGGDGGTGTDGATGVSAGASDLQTKIANKNPLANVKYGIQDSPSPTANEKADATPPAVDRNAEFEKLIKGEYKDLYDARMQDTIQKRLKGTKETVEKYEAISPVLEMLSAKYGIKDASDINALTKAIQEDDSYYEDEALEKGLTVEQLKSVKKMERENAELKRQISAQKADDEAKKAYAGWIDQAERAKAKYPSLNLMNEIRNPQFASLLKSGIDVETAYTVVHKDEIIPAAMQYTAKQTEQRLTNKIIASGARPTENGVNSRASAVVKSSVSQLSKEDRAEIIRRVQQGEKIRF